MKTKTMQAISGILSVLSVAGVCLTAYLSAKQSKKADKVKAKVIEKANGESREVTNKEKLSVVKEYIPVCIVGGATAASIISSTILSRKVEASLVATAAMISQGWRRYGNNVKKVLGIEKHNEVVKEIAKEDLKYEGSNLKDRITADRKLYHIEHIGFFIAEPSKVAHAFEELHRRLCSNDYCTNLGAYTFKDFIKDCEGELLHKNLAEDYLDFGWCWDQMAEKFENPWTHEHLSDEIDDNGNEFVLITFEEEPVYKPEMWAECWVKKYMIGDYLKDCPEEYRLLLEDTFVSSPYYEYKKQGEENENR